MAEVWATDFGGRYHESPDCTGIADGHAKAIERGKTPTAPQPYQLDELLEERDLLPCMICWPSGPNWVWDRFEHDLMHVRDSEYESLFASQVLRHVAGVAPNRVTPQHTVVGRSGRTYRVDFAILMPDARTNWQGIAIEVDGLNKTDRSEMDVLRQTEASERQNDLANAGWTVLRFTNWQATNNPGSCIRDVEEALARAGNHTLSGDPTLAELPTAPAPAPAPAQLAREKDPPSRRPFRVVAATGVIAVIFVGFWLYRTGSSPASGGVNPVGNTCPAAYPVEGNIASGGTRIYHMPGWRYYDATNPERCFANPAAAEAEGFRASEVK